MFAVSAIPAAAAAAFTPEAAALGGLILGISASAKLLLTGRVLGISGAMKGIVTGSEPSPWRFAFLGGMALGAVAVPYLVPSAVEALPGSLGLGRMAVAGLMVGLGAALGNGCTSGHGVCGTARFAPRSLAFTATFMAAGAVAAELTNTLAALQVPLIQPVFEVLSRSSVQQYLGIAGVATAVFATLGAIGARLKRKSVGSVDTSGALHTLELVSEAACGAFFSVGLGVSGMTHPAKMAGFLSILHVQWDASLVFVMATAVVISSIAFNSVAGPKLALLPPAVAGNVSTSPIMCPAYSLPPTGSRIDRRLILGAVVFGAGLGLGGLCPGPSIVNLFAGATPQVMTHLSFVAVGMVAEGWLSKALPFLHAGKQPAAAKVE
ncbi:MAG: hypothetical protein WDW36_006828 [Sanguina aurantia]